MHVVWVIWLNSANRHLGTIKLQDVFAVQPQSPSPQSDYIAQHVVYVPRGNCTLSNVYRTYWRQRSRGSGALKRAHDWTLHTLWQPYWQLNYNFWTFIVRWKCCIFFGSHFQIAGLVWAAVSNRRKKLHSRSSKTLLFYLDKGLQRIDKSLQGYNNLASHFKKRQEGHQCLDPLLTLSHIMYHCWLCLQLTYVTRNQYFFSLFLPHSCTLLSLLWTNVGNVVFLERNQPNIASDWKKSAIIHDF